MPVKDDRPELPLWVYGKRGPSRETPAITEKEAAGYLLKRPCDALLALVGLMIAAPLWILFSLAIKLEDRGPVYFTQERWGRDRGQDTRVQVPEHGAQRHGAFRQRPGPGA